MNATISAADTMSQEVREVLERLVRDADREPDGDYLTNANKNYVAVSRNHIERIRALLQPA